MKNLVSFVTFFLLAGIGVFAQVGINTNNDPPNSAAMLDVQSTDKGFLPPRMTTEQMNSIVTPPAGLLVYNTAVNALFWFNGSTWKRFIDTYTESDPVFTVHPASGISAVNISNWNTAFGWGDHATAGYLKSFTETDPIFGAHPASGITAGNITNWNIAYINRITATNGTAPLALSISGNALFGSIAAANATTNGYLTSVDWNSFNNKVSSQWTANGLKLHYNTGNVGIGTTNPQSKVDIAGNAVIGSTYSGASAAPPNGLLVEGQAGFGTVTPDASAALEVTSTNSGLLLPRMTRVQRNAIASPAEGLMVYCTTCGSSGSLSIFTNGSWMTFSPCVIAAPAAASPVLSQGQIIWNWLATAGASGYKWNTSTDYETATDMAAATTKTETGTNCGITYNRYVWAYSSCGESAMTTLTATVPAAVPEVPVVSTHISTQTSIVWNWNTASDAIGYKWNTTDDYASAIEMGTATTKSESGLTCATNYTRFVWAYNGCGYSTSLSLAQSTLACWICGDPFTRNHLASGGVAPVDKTVAYGTATNIPGELTKCWITRNLGAAQQATVVSDNTETSAGWYFQFNRKQGYQYISSRIPTTTWISSISESSNWITANDPCTIELGTGWRLPTSTEWTNVDASGSWTNWNGPYGSALKLHAAGYLNYSDGSLLNRGSNGYFWSSTQNDATLGWYLYFYSSYSLMNTNYKANGFSIRCLRDN